MYIVIFLSHAHMYTILVLRIHHNFAKHRAKQSTALIWHSYRFDVHVSALQRPNTLYVKTRLKDGVIQSGHESTNVRNIFCWLAFCVHVDDQLVQVIHVVDLGIFRLYLIKNDVRQIACNLLLIYV